MSVFDFVAKHKSRVVRRAYIKRRDRFTGLYEDDWLEITKDVKKFGRVRKNIDSIRPFKFRFSNVSLVCENESGRYNTHENESSLWYQRLNQQRTLVKYELAFVSVNRELDHNIISEIPGIPRWDVSAWDQEELSVWDGTSSAIFTGLVSGDVSVNDSNEVQFQLKPLSSVFEDYPASRLTGWTTTGMTASEFVTMLRDEQDVNGTYVFRQFFGDTTGNWVIQTTTTNYPELTDTATNREDITTKNCWEIIEQLCEAENFVPYITGDGKFNFVSRGSVDSLSAFEFHGAGSFSPTYGNTIKSLDSYGFKKSKFYSRVQIKFDRPSTITSYYTAESSFEVTGTNNSWVLGDKTLSITNYFVGTSANAQTLADALLFDVSALKNEMSFKTSLVLGLDIFDRFSVFYDPTTFNPNSFWDIYNWADSTTSEDHLFWDRAQGEQVNLQGDEFKFLSFEIDVDKLENNFIAREV